MIKRTEILEITINDISIILIINLQLIILFIILSIMNFTLISKKITFIKYYLFKQNRKLNKKLLLPHILLEYDFYFKKFKYSAIIQFILFIGQIFIYTLEVIGYNCLFGFLTQIGINIQQIIFLLKSKYYTIKIIQNENEKYRLLMKRYDKYFKKQEDVKENEK